MRRTFLLSALVCLHFSTMYASPPQQKDKSDLEKLIYYTGALEVQAKLNQYVYDLYLQQGEGRISEEKYLISLMQLVNREVSRRLKNPNEARKNYFKELYKMLHEMQEFKTRLKVAGIRELDTFVDDLKARIKQTIDLEEVDFKKKKVFEEALQMLYVSEEMIKLDQFQDPSDLSKQINKSKEKLLRAFGEVSSEGEELSGARPTIYDLFVEWKKTEDIKYSLKLADVKLARKNLLKDSGIQELLRMFNDQLKVAYLQFNYQDYDLAEILLRDLRETYTFWGIKNLDDVYFYQAECNFALDQFLHAQKVYEDLVKEYPSSEYLPKVYSRLVQIYYTLGNFDKVIDYATLYQNISSSNNPDNYDIKFLLSLAYFQQGNFEESIEILLNIPSDHTYYELGQYFVANAYVESELYDEAVQTYTSLIDEIKTPRYIHERSLYKMGILEYERKNYTTALEYLTNISTGMSGYDKVLNAIAWSYFEKERSKPLEEGRDFSQARYFANRLIAEYYASPYKMEALGLLAYINQFENNRLRAVSLYREVYQTKTKKGSIQTYVMERDWLEGLYQDALVMKAKALKGNNTEAYFKASSLVESLNKKIEHLDLAESSSSGVSVYSETKTVITQIRELNRLQFLAEEMGNKKALKKIDSLQTRLAIVLESLPSEIFTESANVNFFDDYPVTKNIVETELNHFNKNQKEKEIGSEIDKIDDMIQQINNKIAQAKVDQEFKLIAQLEQKRNRLQNLKKEYDQLYVGLRQTETVETPYADFNRWGDLGAFGIINVYFDQKQSAQGQLVKTADVFKKVNTQLDYKKQVIESKIKKIQGEIRFMTMKAKMEERTRLRAERERAFRESYFDTRESETPEEEN